MLKKIKEINIFQLVTWKIWCACALNFIKNNPFKTHPVVISIIYFFISIILLAFKRNSLTVGITVSAFGSIFMALKYKLDQESYHKNLFEERYKIFGIVDSVLLEYAQEGAVTSEIINKLDVHTMRRSYFLFCHKIG